MAERWIGILVSSDSVVVVDAEVDVTGPLVVQADQSWPLQTGDRAAAYELIHKRMSDYVRDQKITKAIVKGSAVSIGGTKLPHLLAAELRGVILCALAPLTKVETDTKAHMSKTFGDRKIDEYLKDSSFWSSNAAGGLRVGSREAAMLLLAGRPK